MIVHQKPDGSYEQVSGNPVLVSLDGQSQAPLETLLADSFSDDDRAAYGIFRVDPAPVPAGYRVTSSSFQMVAGVLTQVLQLEAAPDAGHGTLVASGFVTNTAGVVGPLMGFGFSNTGRFFGAPTAAIPGVRIRFYFAGDGQPDLNYQVIASVRHTVANSWAQPRSKTLTYVDIWTPVDASEYAVDVKRYV